MSWNEHCGSVMAFAIDVGIISRQIHLVLIHQISLRHLEQHAMFPPHKEINVIILHKRWHFTKLTDHIIAIHLLCIK